VTEHYYSFLSILPAVIWLIIFLVITFFVVNNNKDKPHYKYYSWNVYAKFFFALAYGVFYVVIYQGGDTVAYYDGAVTLNNLFFKSPALYLEELTSQADLLNYTTKYDISTGIPPLWIYREPEAWMISRIMSLFSFFTLKSYWAMTIIMAYFTSLASWKLFELVRVFKFNNEKLLAFGVLLLPSVNFWCAGVSKDTIVFIATLVLVYHVFKIVSEKFKATVLNYIIAIIAALLISQMRPFILAAIAIPMAFSLSSRIIRFLGGGNMFVIVFRSIVLIAGLAIAGNALIATNEAEFLDQNAYLQEAAVIQKDFQQNQTYGDKRYSLGTVEFTPVGLVRVAPMAILTGLFRPYLWEALSPTLIMNGLESVIFLYFIFILVRRDFFKKWYLIRTNEFLVFCLIFVLIIAFMTGLTSGLYGVLVRLRAPLLPFLFILSTIDLRLRSTNNEQQIEPNKE
jgi:hypothetical protein